MPHLKHLSSLASILLCASCFGSSIEYIDNGRGSVPVHLPSSYDGTEPLPLIISLHGYNDPNVEAYFDFVPQVDEKNFIYCIPTGTTNFTGASFWNGTNACCDIFNSNVDDSGYLRQIIELIQAQYAVDEYSIHFTGISNGAFMSYRMACDHADLIASIAPLAGTTYDNADACDPSEPVHVLHIHGTSDSTIEYGGGCFFLDCYPGAEQSVSTWLDYNGCSSSGVDGGAAFNLDWSVGGNETTSTIYQQECEGGVTVELWRMAGSEHVPNFRRNSDPVTSNLFANRTIDWLLTHRKAGEIQCSGDVDDDGTVGVEDLLSVLAAWGTDDAAADVDLDGTVGVTDLLALIQSWGDCNR